MPDFAFALGRVHAADEIEVLVDSVKQGQIRILLRDFAFTPALGTMLNSLSGNSHTRQIKLAQEIRDHPEWLASYQQGRAEQQRRIAELFPLPEWALITSVENGFSAQFPKAPALATNRVGPLEIISRAVALGYYDQYELDVVTSSNASEAVELDGLADLFKENLTKKGHRLLSDQPHTNATWGRYRVFRFKNNQKDQVAEYRVLKNNTSVLVLGVHQADDAVSSEFKDRFFGSVRLGVADGSKPQPAQPPVE